MRLSTPQIMSLFKMSMDFTRDAKFDILSVSPDGTLTVRVTNDYGERGFEIGIEGGSPLEVEAMRRATAALKMLVGESDAAGANT